MTPLNRILRGHALDVLAGLPDESVHCVVTSPPYWGLRDYGVAGQLGLEPVLDCLGWATKQPCGECYICTMTAVFREVRRVLRRDGVCWVNMGDSYAGSFKGAWSNKAGGQKNTVIPDSTSPQCRIPIAQRGLKPKDLCMVPARLALALQADGWWLRDDVIWHKPNPMPSSCTDRTTKAHEYLYLLTRSRKYFFDHVAIQEPAAALNAHDATGQGYAAPGQAPHTGTRRPRLQSPLALSFAREVREPDRPGQSAKQHRTSRSGNTARKYGDERGRPASHLGTSVPWEGYTRNRRSVWTVPTYPFPEAHFATYPPDLVRPCIQAGTSERGVCLACGKPWARETESALAFASGSGRSGNDPVGKNGSGLQGGGETGDIRKGPVRTYTTTGWSPSCVCDAGAPVPAVVLDPFMGSGTTALVARGLGRDWLGIELNEEYAAMAEKRLREAGPLLEVKA